MELSSNACDSKTTLTEKEKVQELWNSPMGKKRFSHKTYVKIHDDICKSNEEEEDDENDEEKDDEAVIFSNRNKKKKPFLLSTTKNDSFFNKTLDINENKQIEISIAENDSKCRAANKPSSHHCLPTSLVGKYMEVHGFPTEAPYISCDNRLMFNSDGEYHRYQICKAKGRRGVVTSLCVDQSISYVRDLHNRSNWNSINNNDSENISDTSRRSVSRWSVFRYVPRDESRTSFRECSK